jgi:nucleoid-associated protein EbfC
MPSFDPRQLQEMMSMAKRQYEELQRKMQETTVEASSGGGSVSVKMNGQKQVLDIKIDPEVVKSGDLEMLQDLVMAAVNEALKKVHAEMAEEMSKITGGLNIPGLF